jgi:hypothetical protein
MIQYIIGAIGGVIIGGLLKENELEEKYKSKKEKKEKDKRVFKKDNVHRRFTVAFQHAGIGGGTENDEYSFKSLKKAQEFLDKVLKLGFFPLELEDYDGQEMYDEKGNQIFYKAGPHRIWLMDEYSKDDPLKEYDEDTKEDKKEMKKVIEFNKKWESQEPEDIKKGNLLYAGTEKDFKDLWKQLN